MIWWSRYYDRADAEREAAEDAAQTRFEDRADQHRKGE